jgi:hypothetical protein
MAASRVFRTSERDFLVLSAALVHAALLAGALAFVVTGRPEPLTRGMFVVALGLAMNWGSNTVSHIHLHGPLFRGARANRAFSIFLTVLYAVPQSWWKLRHLEHHRLPSSDGAETGRGLRAQGLLELAALLALVIPLAARAPLAFATVYAPATLLGFVLCANQGRQEHRGGAEGVDVRGHVYNRLWFNDGFHAAHHRAPEAHWTTLPAGAAPEDVVSALPPLLRWLEEARPMLNRAAAIAIDALERATLGVPAVRRALVSTHTRAFALLLARTDARAIREVTIIGGGLFPRTALVLARLLPHARLTLLDAVPAHLDRARAFLEAGAPSAAKAARYVTGRFDPHAPPPRADLLVVPLAFRGDRACFYAAPPAPRVVVHDWLWRRRGTCGVRISLLLVKRLNLVSHDQDEPERRGDLVRPGHPPLV